MSYTVKVTIDSVETDITDYVVRGSVSRDFILHKDLKPATSTAGFKVLGSYRTLLDSLLLSKAEVPCTILKDSSPYFTGIISPKYSLKAAQARAEQVSIQVEDFNVSRLKRKIDSNVKLTGYYISDPVTPGQSIIHALASLAGVGVDATTAPSIPIQVPIYVVLSDDDKKYEDELTNLLYSYGYVYYFNESGELAFYFFGDYDTSEITTGFKNIVGDSGSNCLEAIKVEKSRETYDKIKLKWYELELKEDQVLFEDTTDGDAEGCNIELDSGEYYPEGSGEANVYSEYDLEGLIGAVSAVLDAEYDSGISISTAFVNYGKKALFALQSSADNQYITKLRIVGDAYVQKSKNFTIETINADVQNILDYESLYIFDKANAEAFGLILHNYYQYSDFNYLIKSKSAYDLGAYVKIEDDIHLSFIAYGRIREIKEDSEGVFAYYIEGVSEYITIGSSETQKNQDGTPIRETIGKVVLDLSSTVKQYWEQRYKRSATAPSAPTLADPADWFVAIPSGTDPIWVTGVLKNADGTLAGTWADPRQINTTTQWYAYHDNAPTSAPATPTGEGTSGGWHANETSASVWVSVKTSVLRGDAGTWSTPAVRPGITLLPTYSPKYLGPGRLSATGTAAFRKDTISPTGVITTGSNVTPNPGDWMYNYDTSLVAPLSVFRWSGTAWETGTVTWEHWIAATEDIGRYIKGGTTEAIRTARTPASWTFLDTLFASEAFIDRLAARQIRSANYSAGIAGMSIDLNSAIIQAENGKWKIDGTTGKIYAYDLVAYGIDLEILDGGSYSAIPAETNYGVDGLLDGGTYAAGSYEPDGTIDGGYFMGG